MSSARTPTGSLREGSYEGTGTPRGSNVKQGPQRGPTANMEKSENRNQDCLPRITRIFPEPPRQSLVRCPRNSYPVPGTPPELAELPKRSEVVFIAPFLL